MGKKVKKEVEAPPKDAFDPVNIESKKTGTVVLMLSSEEEEVLAKACEAIYRFADKCDDNKALLLELGAIESIIRLINHEDKTVKRFACMAFGTMAAHAEVRKYLRKTDSISAAINLLGDEDDVCNEFSSLFLAHMSNDFVNKLTIGENNGLEPLVNLLASPDPDIQKNCLEALSRLVEDFQSRTMIRDLGGIPAILDLLKSDYAVIQELALTSLASLTLDGDARAILRENEGLEALVEFLENKEYEDLHINALGVISNCLVDPESLNDIRNTGGMTRILTFITESQASPTVQSCAAQALARASKNAENSKILHEQEVEKTLITMVGSDNDEIRTSACQAIATLSDNLAAKDTFGRSEGIPHVVGLLASENPSVKDASTLALANLTLNNANNSSEVIACGGVEQLLGLLEYAKESVVINATACLINMAQDVNLRAEVSKRGIIAALGAPLKSNSPKIQTKIAQALCAYVNGAEARAEVLQHGALEPLVQLLHTNDNDVRRNASLALTRCCADGPSAEAVLKLGGLELLQQINASEQRRSNSSMAAFNSLVESNLSAKYCLTGRLASHDIIDNGFYDAGQLRPDAKFLSLEELAKQKVSSDRAVLLINCKSSDTDLRPEDESETDYEQDESDPTRVQSPTDADRKKTDRQKSPLRLGSASVSSSQDESSDKRVSSKASSHRRKKKDKEAQRKEDAERAKAEEEDDTYRPAVDTALVGLMEEVTKHVEPLPKTQEQIIALAQYVSRRMGGEVEREKLMEFSWQLHIAQLKFDLKSNVIPLGKIQFGIHFHRALLYKVLADRIGVPCTLVRGEYNRAWNEVTVATSLNNGSNKSCYPPTTYVVDLMHDPGRLMKNDSRDALLYQSI